MPDFGTVNLGLIYVDLRFSRAQLSLTSIPPAVKNGVSFRRDNPLKKLRSELLLAGGRHVAQRGWGELVVFWGYRVTRNRL